MRSLPLLLLLILSITHAMPTFFHDKELESKVSNLSDLIKIESGKWKILEQRVNNLFKSNEVITKQLGEIEEKMKSLEVIKAVDLLQRRPVVRRGSSNSIIPQNQDLSPLENYKIRRSSPRPSPFSREGNDYFSSAHSTPYQ